MPLGEEGYFPGGQLRLIADDGSELRLDADTGDDNTIKLTITSNGDVLEEEIPWSTWKDVLHFDTEIFKLSI